MPTHAISVDSNLADPNTGDASSSGIPVTYTELVALITSNSLLAGKSYLLTDFRTTHYIVDGFGNQFLSSIISAPIEVLTITATGGNTVDHCVYSSLYPQDVIRYDWNPLNWLKDLSFADLTTDSENPTIVPGFKGVIYFRHDTLLDNRLGYDFRHVKFRRWKSLTPAWVSGVYNETDSVRVGNLIFTSLVSGNTQEPVDVNSTQWTLVFDLSKTEYIISSITGTTGFFTDTASFIDALTFTEGAGTAIYEICCRGNHFETFKDSYDYQDVSSTILSNNVFFLQDEGYFSVYNNTMAPASFGNTIGGAFHHNDIGTFFSNNLLHDGFNFNAISHSFIRNKIGKNFKYNTIGQNFNNNFISTDFARNDIGDGFQANLIGYMMKSNSIKDDFNNNKVFTNFLGNKVGNTFNNNTIYAGFQHNTANNGIGLVIITLVAGDPAYKDYDTTLFKNSAGEIRLSYYNASNVLTVVNPTV